MLMDNIVKKAELTARKWHDGQTYGDGRGYTESHLAAVVSMVAENLARRSGKSARPAARLDS